MCMFGGYNHFLLREVGLFSPEDLVSENDLLRDPYTLLPKVAQNPIRSPTRFRLYYYMQVRQVEKDF